MNEEKNVKLSSLIGAVCLAICAVCYWQIYSAVNLYSVLRSFSYIMMAVLLFYRKKYVIWIIPLGIQVYFAFIGWIHFFAGTVEFIIVFSLILAPIVLFIVLLCNTVSSLEKKAMVIDKNIWFLPALLLFIGYILLIITYHIYDIRCITYLTETVAVLCIGIWIKSISPEARISTQKTFEEKTAMDMKEEEKDKKMSGSKKIMVSILIAIVCICAIFWGLSAEKKQKAKEEYTALLEERMKDIGQKYGLSNVAVQVTTVKKGNSRGYIFGTTINFEGDAKAFDNENNDDYSLFDFQSDIYYDDSLWNMKRLPSSGIGIDAFDSILYYTTVELNGNVIFTPRTENKSSSSSSSKNSSRCKVCGRSFTDDENKKSIRHTNMCVNCYNNYQFGVEAQSAAEQYRQNSN